jgi:hypothetical protein
VAVADSFTMTACGILVSRNNRTFCDRLLYDQKLSIYRFSPERGINPAQQSAQRDLSEHPLTRLALTGDRSVEPTGGTANDEETLNGAQLAEGITMSVKQAASKRRGARF